MKATALEEKIAGVGIQIIPRDLANFGGDTAILKWILQDNTAIVGFSCYMWNIERNIYLAHELKKQDPGIIIIFGGPEIDDKHWALNNKDIDTFITGEGEQIFSEINAGLSISLQILFLFKILRPITVFPGGKHG
ncbi:MAG: cobalamin-dependent protein [Acidobacteria bacterium]|nr:cobalamin-dependent protein [Acidobacteriota bacterium]